MNLRLKMQVGVCGSETGQVRFKGAERPRPLLVAQVIGGVLAVASGLLTPHPDGATTVWIATGLFVLGLSVLSWIWRHSARVPVCSLATTQAAVTVLLLFTTDQATAAVLVLPMLLGGQLGAFLMSPRSWRWFGLYVVMLTVIGVGGSPAGLGLPHQTAAVSFVVLGLVLVGGLYSRTSDLAHRDALTGAMSRATAEAVISDRLQLNQPRRCVLALVDLDKLKEVNDTFGHQAGDMALIGVVNCLSQKLRRHDVVARYGGDEFLVVLYDRDEEEAGRLLATARAHCPYPWSFGLTNLRQQDTLAAAVGRADAALYSSKTGVVDDVPE